MCRPARTINTAMAAQRQVQVSINHAEVTLDDDSVDTLRALSRMTSEFRQSTSAVRRIQRGSPGAGALGSAVQMFRYRFTPMLADCQGILNGYPQFPGMNLLRTRLNELDQALQEPFNDGGNESGYYQRVQVLEKLNYVNGMLRSAVEMIIEHHEYWKNKIRPIQTIVDDQQLQVARRLDFNENSRLVNQRTPRSGEGLDARTNGILGKYEHDVLLVLGGTNSLYKLTSRFIDRLSRFCLHAGGHLQNSALQHNLQYEIAEPPPYNRMRIT